MVLGRKFYQKDTLKVAQDLLGCFLIRKIASKVIRARIVETEAYIGEDDLACHASKGRTPRTETMYGEAGRAYVYMIYGMYHCLNVVTEKKDYPAAVLIRELDNPEKYDKNKNSWIPIGKMNLDGPGKLCRSLDIDRRLNGHDLVFGERLWIEESGKKLKGKIVSDRRIGIDYAQHCKEYLWRFRLTR